MPPLSIRGAPMRGRKKSFVLQLTEQQRAELQRWQRTSTLPVGLVRRARRILNGHKLKPWRHHLWLSPKVPRDAAFAAQVREICDLYTRPLASHEVVLCADEKTSLQPRTRKSPTRAARPGQPVRVEHEYER